MNASRTTGQFRVTFASYAPLTRLDRHDHELASFCIAVCGGYDEQLDRRSRRVEAGILVIHPEGETHADRHDPRRTDLLTVEFSSASLDLARRISPRFDESWHRPALTLLPAAYRILHHMDQSCPTSALLIEDTIWEMIAEAVKHEQRDAGRPKWLLHVHDSLESCAGNAPTMLELSEMAGVHPVHLARAFRQAFGSSIGEFVRQQQVAAALKLLADSRLGLAEISVATGFADQSHMTRRIRELTGRPPGIWRKRLTAKCP